MTEPARRGTCPRCGTAYAPGQEYCLECGLRLPTHRGAFGRLASAWAGRAWYPGDWIWPVLVFLVLAALGAVAAILISNGNSSTSPAIVATPPGATSGPGDGTTTPPPPTTTAPPPTTTPPTTTTPPPSRNQVSSWPGQNGFTLVLESIPTNAGRSGASQTAKRALQAGLPQVGILDSSQYSSLHPGYYVVFSGIYSSYAEASSHVAAAKAGGFRSAYPKAVTK